MTVDTLHLAKMAEALKDKLASFIESRAQTVANTFTQVTLKGYLRIVIIIGTYLLFRRFLVQYAKKGQTADHERELDFGQFVEDEAAKKSTQSQVEVPPDSDEEDGATTGANWGRPARRRQRDMIKNLLEAEEQKRIEEAGDASDKDIEEFLVKE